ncbi:LuxR C-terminal-related transcriptional regulator [Sphingobium bisphenolivorans]|uniref:LuxR C-terminal-related transcriptional regulator n=1 Tax=Sphingobium bisphenolivorans TaxID=1335760 RepID=UPI00039C41CF|nr:response regulator transcription factor [Sphingobium bisphenolivorans]
MLIDSEVAIIGRDSIIRESLKRLLLEEGHRIFNIGSSLADLYKDSAPDERPLLLILLEDKKCRWEGIELAGIDDHYPASSVVILAEDFNYDAMLEAFRAGVDGYLTNDISWDRLSGYLHLISLGEKIFPSKLADKLIDQAADGPTLKTKATIDSVNLSAREREILQRLIAGSPNKIISRELAISEATVKVHVKAVLRKLGVVNRTQAAIWAASQGLQGSGSGLQAAARQELKPRAYPAAIDSATFQPHAKVAMSGSFKNGHAGRA